MLVGLVIALALSGAASLVYQTAWARMLNAVLGVSDVAVASVLATFFLGLGIGSALASKLAGRVTQPALAYAALEVIIGLYAFASILIVPELKGAFVALGAHADFTTLLLARAAIASALLLVPTTLMGATLPLLIEAVARSEREWPSAATLLYAVNTLGAAGGAAYAGFVAIPQHGLRAAVMIGGFASFGAAAIAVVTFGLGASRGAGNKDPLSTRFGPKSASQEAMRLGLALGAVSGFTTLAGEVLWTRVLRIIVQGTTTAFAAMLVHTLIGIGLGSLIADRAVRDGRSPLRALALVQALLACATLIAIAVAAQLPRFVGPLEGVADLTPHRATTVLLLSGCLLLPLSLAAGASLPLVLRGFAPIPRLASSYAGKLLAINTVAGLTGSLVAGLLLVPALGLERSLFVLAIAYACTSAAASGIAEETWLRRVLFGLPLPVIVLLCTATGTPSLHLPFLLDARNDVNEAIVKGPNASRFRDRLLFLEEGRSTTVTVLTEDDTLRLYNDGRPESGLSTSEPGYGAELALLGALPSLFAERRERALVIGLGAGHTTTALLAGPFRSVEVVELEPAVVRAARLIHRARRRSFPLDDDRVQLVIDDARSRLALAADGTLDAVVSQPSHPWLAGSSALYTEELFREVRRVLRSGGVFALWVNLFRNELVHVQEIVATLLTVFPEVHGFAVEPTSLLLVATTGPRPMGDAVRSRVENEPAIAELLAPHGLDRFVDLAAARVLDPPAARALARGAFVLTDDEPRLEHALAALPNDRTVALREFDRAVDDTPFLDPESLATIPGEQRGAVLAARIERARGMRAGIDRVARSLTSELLDAPVRTWLRGAIAEARADVATALRAYDAARIPAAAAAADRLRLEEGRHTEAMSIALARGTPPATTDALLSHAAAIGDAEAIAAALRIRQSAEGRLQGAAALVLESYATLGCAGVLASSSLDEAVLDEHLAGLAARCAQQAGDRVRGSTYAERWATARRVRAIALFDRGKAERDGGLPRAAERSFRLALNANPTHGLAAGALAELLAGSQRRDEARAVLVAATEASRGLPEARAALERVATKLDIEL